MKVQQILRNFNRTLFLAGTLSLATACEKGPSLIPEILDGKFEISSFQGKPQAEWVIGTGNELRTRSYNWNIAGACGSSIKTVKIFINSTQAGSEVSCDGSSFSWTKNAAVLADGTYNVDVIPYDGGGVEVADKRISKVVQVDNVAPSSISLTSVVYYRNDSLINQSITSGASLNLMVDENSDGCTNSQLGIRLTGSYTPDSDPAVLDKLVITPSGGMTFHSGSQFDFRFCMTSGENRSVTIQAVDDLGNVSNTLTAAISVSSPMTSIKVGGSFNPGFSGSSVAAAPMQTSNGMTLVNVHMGNVLSEAVVSSGVGSASLATGFVNVLSKVSP